MKKNILSEIEVPSEIQASLNESVVTMKANGKEIVRKFPENPNVEMKQEGRKIIITSNKATKRELKLINSIVAHIYNMISGLKEEFVYKLEVCNVHFPMVVKVDGNDVKIKNFLGEKIDRHAKILPNVKVKVSGNNIEVSSPDVEAAGQTAARLEIATKIRNRDRRVFQDGIFITSKPDRKTQ
jgi:large subunit ribosomal protein L6